MKIAYKLSGMLNLSISFTVNQSINHRKNYLQKLQVDNVLKPTKVKVITNSIDYVAKQTVTDDIHFMILFKLRHNYERHLCANSMAYLIIPEFVSPRTSNLV